MALPDLLHESLCSTDIDVRAGERLNAVYYRNVARRLSAADDVQAGATPAWRQVRWLPVDAVHQAHLKSGAVAGAQPTQPDLRPAVALGAGTFAPLCHVTAGDVPEWAEYGLNALGHNLANLEMGGSVEVAHGCRAAIHQVEAAIHVLKEVWPAAVAEFGQLVHAVVYADGAGGLRSASLVETFGAIYVGRDLMRNVTSTVEMLLHETGHHAMYVRSAYTTFVMNDQTVATHPLRQDPRPLSGILHAAFVLARICRGLTSWVALGRDPEVEHRLDVNCGRLVEVLDVLDQHGEFTSDGDSLMLDMTAVARSSQRR